MLKTERKKFTAEIAESAEKRLKHKGKISFNMPAAFGPADGYSCFGAASVQQLHSRDRHHLHNCRHSVSVNKTRRKAKP
jgi:hypothetical protein